ncbi:MAG: hypothetical protein WED27_07245 [Pirellulales bacterium]
MNEHGRTIDEVLRDIAVPVELPRSVRPEALFADDQLDRLLAGVVVPADLAERVHARVGTRIPRRRNGAIDLKRFTRDHEAASEADGPRAAPRHRERTARGLLGLARETASVVMALGLAGLIAVAGVEFSRRLEGPVSRVAHTANSRAPSPANESRPRSEPPARVAPDADRGGIERTVAAAPLVDQPDDSSLPAVGDVLAAPHAVAATDAALTTAGETAPRVVPRVLGAPMWPAPEEALQGPPAMTTVDVPGDSRRHVPRVRGYDLAFEMTIGEQPFIDPAADPTLAVSRPPLTLRSTGFETLVSGEPRGRKKIRAEEVLAAVPARSAAAFDGPAVRLDIYQVRSPLRRLENRPSILLEVAASAGRIQGAAGDETAPVESTIMVDQAAAGDPAVWPRICRGLGAVATHMAPADRVTVVLCGPRPRVAVRAANAAQLAAVAADLEWLPATASSDLSAGLDAAAPARRVVVIAHSSSLDGSRGGVREALSAWHTALSATGGDSLSCNPAGGTRFIVLDPATPSPSRHGDPTFGRTSPDAVSISRALLQQVTGRDTLVARHCELELRIDPREVARYRLIGHRQSAIESLADVVPGGIDLHAGETVRAVYEIVPHNGTDRIALATASLTWRTPGGSSERIEATPRGATSELGAGLPSSHGCEILLAAGLGELAAGSGHMDRRQAALLTTALEKLAADWNRRGDVTQFAAALMRTMDRSAGGRQGTQ